MKLRTKLLFLAFIATTTGASSVVLADTKHHGPKTYIIAPHDGDAVPSPVRVQFGLMGMGVAPAGVDKKNTGHHHLLIDVDTLPAMDQPIPKDDHHKHFGGGQTETMLDLTQGQHTLQLILGDKDHIPHGEGLVSKKITITVK